MLVISEIITVISGLGRSDFHKTNIILTATPYEPGTQLNAMKE